MKNQDKTAPLSAKRAAYTTGDDAIKIALVGCGGRGTGAAVQAMSTQFNVKLVAMADMFADQLSASLTNMKRMPEIADKIEVPEERQFTGFDAYQKAIQEADVVLLATPPGFRPQHFEAAISQGKHVFMEKPVAVDPVGVRKVLANIKKAKEQQLSVVVGLQRRFSKIYRQEVLPRIRKGLIGEIVAASAYWQIGYIGRPEERNPEHTEMEHQLRNWYQFPWLSGDHIEDTHIHNLDVVNWVLDGYPIRAQAMGGREIPYAKGKGGAMFDHHFVEFEYPNGVIVSSQSRQINQCRVHLGEYFTGTKGRLFSNTKRMSLTDLQGKELDKYRDRDDPNPQQIEHDELFEAIVKGEPVNDAEHGAYSTMTSILGRLASYSGQMVSWEDALNADYDIGPKEHSLTANPPIMPNENGEYPLPVPGKFQFM